MRSISQVALFAGLAFCALTLNPALAVTLPAFDLPEIGSIDLPKSAKAGEPVQITVKGSKDGTSACGIVVNFGDGTNQQYKVNVDNAKLPLGVEHVYKKAGNYTVKVTGKKVTTHHSCKGGASAAIKIGGAAKKATKTTK